MSNKAKDPKVIQKKISHKPIDYEKLNRLPEDFGKRFTPQQELSAEQAFWLRISNPTIEPSKLPPPVKREVPCELPKVFKDQFDSIKKTRVRTKEQSDSLIDKLNFKSAKNEDLKAQIQDKVFVITSLKNDLRKLKGKETNTSTAQIPSATTIVPGMFKLDLDPLATIEQAKDTCPNAIKHSAKKDAVTPKNNIEKVSFAEPLTSSSNTKQVESSKSSDSNTPVLSSTGLKCSTSKCGSKPTGNNKNDRISQTPSRNIKNKVEVQPRKVHNKNRIVEPICDAIVKHSLLNANFELVCVTCCTDCTVTFGNDQIARIMGYGDYQLGNAIISRVYYIEGLGHNLFSVGKFYDMDLEVAFWLHRSVFYPKHQILELVMAPSVITSQLRSLCYPINDNEDLGKLDVKADIGLVSNPVSQQPCIPPNIDDWNRLFQPMFDEYFNPPYIVVSPVQEADAPSAKVLADSPVTTSIDQDAPSASIPSSQEQEHSPIIS
ncbi:hypothetical protein Tco_0712150 [Tanacetum coccineum]